MRQLALALLAAGLASPALAGAVALRPVTAAPAAQQAISQIKGGAICIKQGPTTASEMRHAIEGGGFDARLREELSKAGVTLDADAAAVAVEGVARVSLVDVCLPLIGFGNTDSVGGKVEVTVDWTLIDRASGAELTRLPTRGLLERKPGPGGLADMVLDAFAGNARALAANAAFRQAAARPALSVPKAEPAVLRDPARLVLEPWRRTTGKAPRAISTPQVIESDLDELDTGDGGLFAQEYFAVQIEAGETLKLEVLDASKSPNLGIADARGRNIAATTPKRPERQLSATLPIAGTYIVQVWSYGDPPNAAYQLRVETDRRPYVKPEPPRPPEPPRVPEPSQANGRSKSGATTPPKSTPPARRPPFAPPVFLN